jgi:pyruvate dehydrogenase E2 component (dihydrolipoamide acetyltransferase)
MREGRIAASPLAKRIAQERGVNLYSVIGTGPNGRIVKDDVLLALTSVSAGKPASPDKQTSAPNLSGVAQSAKPDAKQLADMLGQKYTEEKNSAVRKVIAKRLTESKQTVPHFYLSVDCELDALLAARSKLNAAENAKVSVNDLVIKATALALREVPAANASWTDDAILKYTDVDISIAVATPSGLITPIIKKADEKSILDISKSMKDLAARARDNKLKPEEFQGGGFSISNLGMFGIKHFAAIINPPQGCILAIGAGVKTAVVKNDQLAIATVMTVTLSVDHRVVDGAVGAEFTAAFKKIIEAPEGWVK